MSRNYSELTLSVTRQLSKAEKKEYGFFVTPPSIIDAVLTRIKTLQSDIKTILEPSCGTCEFITASSTVFPEADIDGVEWNRVVFTKTQEKFPGIHHADFTTWHKGDYDLIIGNPPYFVCSKEVVPTPYREYMTGRPNMFGIFILHALTCLKPNGILAFVIPKSFMNAAFYAKIREYILETCSIIDILDFEGTHEFLETQQATMGLILRKNAPLDIQGHLPTNELNGPSLISNLHQCKYAIKIGGQWIFTKNAEKLRELLEGSTTLTALGYSVKTGAVVWNQHKDKMTNDKTKPILIYNSNINL